MKTKALVLGILLTMFSVSGASATVTFQMYESYYNKDGALTLSLDGDAVFGTLTFTDLGITTPGSHYSAVYVDAEIDQDINGFTNEYGSVAGSAAAGQSWEIDEPGFEYGDIYDNFVAGTLDKSNGVPTPDDVAMALAWNFILADGESATVSYFLTPVQPTSGFYLAHTDPDSQASLYFYSTLTIQGGGPQPTVPEPSTLLLFGVGFLGAYLRRKMKN